MVAPVLKVSGFDLPADSVMAAMLATWKEAGGTYKDLFWQALVEYAVSGAYLAALRALDAEAAKRWKEAS